MESRLLDDFFKLKNGLAGAIMQKFTTYGITVAIVLETVPTSGSLKDFLRKSNRGTAFHTYTSIIEAENWLLHS